MQESFDTPLPGHYLHLYSHRVHSDHCLRHHGPSFESASGPLRLMSAYPLVNRLQERAAQDLIPRSAEGHFSN